MLCCFRDKFEIALAVIDSAADFMVSTKRLAFIPILYFFCTLIYICIWAAAIPGVIAFNEISADRHNSDKQMKNIKYTTAGIAALSFMGVGLLWLLIFLADKVRFIIMSCATEFYFDSNKDRDGEASVCSAWSTTFCKHSGSIALGSFIHTLILVVKILIDIVSHGADAGDDGAAACIACIAKCLISCIESAIEWLNTCAYCMTAITGDNYCAGAWGGFMMYLKHLLKFYFAQYIASAFIWLGMIGTVAGNCGLCWLMMSMVFKTDVHMTSVWGPIATIGVVTFIVVCVFLGSFDDAVLATLMSLGVDLEINGEVKGGSKSFHAKLKEIERSLDVNLTRDSKAVNVYQDNTVGYAPL